MEKNEFDINDYLRIDGNIYKEIKFDYILKNNEIYIISFSEGQLSIKEELIINLFKEEKRNLFFHIVI